MRIFLVLLAIIIPIIEACSPTTVSSGYSSISINAGTTLHNVSSITCPSGTYPLSRFFHIWTTDHVSRFSAAFHVGSFSTSYPSNVDCLGVEFSSMKQHHEFLLQPSKMGHWEPTMSLSIHCNQAPPVGHQKLQRVGGGGGASCEINYMVSMECSPPFFPIMDAPKTMCLMAVKDNPYCIVPQLEGRTLTILTGHNVQNRYCCGANPHDYPVFNTTSQSCECGLEQALHFESISGGTAVTGHQWILDAPSTIVRIYTILGGSGQYHLRAPDNFIETFGDTATFDLSWTPIPNQYYLTISATPTEIQIKQYQEKENMKFPGLPLQKSAPFQFVFSILDYQYFGQDEFYSQIIADTIVISIITSPTLHTASLQQTPKEQVAVRPRTGGASCGFVLCDIAAECIPSPFYDEDLVLRDAYICQCNLGFSGNGVYNGLNPSCIRMSEEKMLPSPITAHLVREDVISTESRLFIDVLLPVGFLVFWIMFVLICLVFLCVDYFYARNNEAMECHQCDNCEQV